MIRTLLFLTILLPFTLRAQSLLFEENFNYSENTNLTDYGWANHSGTGSPIQVISPSLIFSGYPPSGVGNAVAVAGGSGSREDVNQQFSEQNTGSVYSAFMVNVSNATTTGSYFFHLGPTSLGTSFRGRVFAKRDASNNMALGIAKADNAAAMYTTFSLSLNTTYLIIMKYSFNSGSTTDDVVSLWIDPDLSSPEPTPDLTQTDSFEDAENLGTVALRQGSDGPVLVLDGIRIGSTWESLSSMIGNLPPVISNINQSPMFPSSTDLVTISADVTDEGSVTIVQLFYSIDSAPFDSTAMSIVTGNTYQATIDPQPDGTTVEYFIKATDNEGLTAASNTNSYTVGSGPTIIPIADIKKDFPTYNGQTVTIQGIVTLGAGITITSRTDAYVQDNSGRGINIFSFDAPDPLLIRGNEVQITGTVTEFSGVIEIENYTIQLISTGNTLPAPLELTTQQANNIDLEGTYIRINGNVTTIETFSDATNLTVDDGSGDILIRVWGTTGIDLSNLAVDDSVSITAVMDLFQSASQLTPGYQDEIVKFGTTPGDGSGIATISPDSVGVSTAVTETIQIIGESPYTLESIQVTVPSDWQWTENVNLSGEGFSGAISDVQDNVITISSAAITDVDQGEIIIENLTSPALNTVSSFPVRTAVAGGSLTPISASPTVIVSSGGPLIIPIAEIKNNFPTYNGQTVTIQGIVTLGAGITITTRTDAYVQDNSGRGINLFSFNAPDPLLVRGNEVQITGTVTEFSGVIEIENYTIQLVSTGNPLPAPLELTTQQANNIALEGTYVKVAGNLLSIDVFSDAANLTVNDGSGDVLVRVWGTTGIDLSNLSVNDQIMISAVMDIFQSASQLTPGYQDEIVKIEIQPGDGSGIATIDPDSVSQNDSGTETITITGESPYILETIQIKIPSEWQWPGNVSISGTGFSGASFDVQDKTITINSGMVSASAMGIIAIQNLTAPSANTISTFNIKTAVSSGVLTNIAESPQVVVGQGIDITSISDIQANTEIFLDSIVTVQGIVTLGAGITSTSWTSAYVQDQSGNGINIYRAVVLDPFLVRGNEVLITGSVDEFDGVTEIVNYTLHLISTGNPIPEPLHVSVTNAKDVSLEGTYVEVAGIVTDVFTFNDGSSNITINDELSDIVARIWVTTEIDIDFISVDDTLVIRAVLGIFQGETQLIPGYQDELDLFGEEKGAVGDGSGFATLNIDSTGVSSSLSSIRMSLWSTETDTLRSIKISIPYNWQWSGLDEAVSMSGTGFQNATRKVVQEYDELHIELNGCFITQTDSGYLDIIDLTTPEDPVFSYFWVRTAVENGNLTYIEESPRVVVGESPIHQIRDIQINSAQFTAQVTLQGVVTIGSGVIRTDRTSAYFQDFSGFGININQSGPPDAQYKRGYFVEITGTISEFSETTQIDPITTTIIDSGLAEPPPIELSTSEAFSPRWDGTLIQVRGIITEKFSTTVPAIPPLDYNLVVNDGTGGITLRVWGTTGINLDSLNQNDAIIGKGVGNVFISNDTRSYQLLPAYQDHLRLDPTYQPSLAGVSLTVPPNPFVPDRGEKIRISYNAGAVSNQITIRIFDLGGRSILTLLSEPANLIQSNILWDGRNKLKDLVPLGTYICHMEVVEPISGDKKIDTAPIVVGTILKK